MDNLVSLEYIWLDGLGDIRSKTRILPVSKLDGEIPKWNYDGSSTYQRHTSDSEVILYPKKQYNDFSRVNPHLFVLCETNDPACTRRLARKIFEESPGNKPMFGFEQEFFILERGKEKFFGTDLPEDENSYCSVGANKCFARKFTEKVMNCALLCGINLTGFNWEVAPGQAEFQVCSYGLEAADDLILLRYLLQKIGEEFNYQISFHPKPILEWNGSGLHTNYSTQAMREEGGIEEIMGALIKLEKTYIEDRHLFGHDNELRLTGDHETSAYNTFTWGVGSRDTSIRIPKETIEKQCGYFEDRRPGSNANPYLVTANLFKVTCLDGTSIYNSHPHVIPKNKSTIKFW